MLSIIPFHRGLIATAIVFCFGYGGWEILGYARSGGAGSFVIGTVFILLGVGLGYYLLRLNRFLGYEREGKGGQGDEWGSGDS